MSTQSDLLQSVFSQEETRSRSAIAEAPADWRNRRELPSRYYLAHFTEFLEVMQNRYAHALAEEHLGFISDFSALTADAQCLYVRMLNRQGELFDTRKFRYAEIPCIPTQLVLLQNEGFCRAVDQDDADEWLGCVTRQELLGLIAAQCATTSYRRSWTKPVLLSFAREHLDFADSSISDGMGSFVIQKRCTEIGYMLFLYFGKIEQGLGKFTLRDLGVMRTGSFKKDFQPRFDTREDAQSSWFYCQKLSAVDKESSPTSISWCDEISRWPSPLGEQSVMLRQQLLYRLGEKLEKAGDTEQAANVYAHSDQWPSTERRVRIIYASGERESAEKVLMQMIDDPSCDDELLFARDFYARKYQKKRTSRITDILRDARILRLDESFRDTPEQGASAYFKARGATVFFSENHLWKSLFGLVFWPLLFENENAGLYNDFEKRPRELDNGGFYQRFSCEIEHCLQQLEDTPQALKILLETTTRRYGTANGIFLWRPNILEPIRSLLQSAPARSLAVVLRRMSKDYASNHSGFPDLLVVQANTARFIEIKAEGDQLRRNQLKQIVALQEAGIAVEVNRVEWVCDPDQTYVVVDIETTGSRAPAGRITEIAAVRVRRGEIIDEWQSLINPCRSIPANITRLTGITNQMVADAPVFQEIANDFSRFSDDAVFVAHNVRFDYSFISAEFRRIDQIYRRPTLCTCVEMRKWYKGSRSYSLGNLCAEYEIPLESHHRAMCDAKAASELLFMINEKRMGLAAGGLSDHSMV